MPYETDRTVLAWFETALADTRPGVRRRAVELLEHVDCEHRSAWLQRAESDDDKQVRAAAVLVQVVLCAQEAADVIELMESDFGDGTLDDDLAWEWEYTFKVCEGRYVPAAVRLVWTRVEDDAAAREIALIKARLGRHGGGELTPVIVAKRVVNRYTRSPRSSTEAMRWYRSGRPRYEEDATKGDMEA